MTPNLSDVKLFFQSCHYTLVLSIDANDNFSSNALICFPAKNHK